MKTFEYYARDMDGQIVQGTIEAQHERASFEMLGDKGLLVVKLKQLESEIHTTAVATGHIPLASLAAFTRQLATMTRVGMPIIQCLDALERQTRHPASRELIRHLTFAVERGCMLSEAMARHPKAFNRVYISMVQAGERSGHLPNLLDRLANYLESSLRLRKKVRSAMTYPIIVSVMAIVIVIFLVTMIIPVFGEIYKQFNHALPKPTRLLIDLSEFLRAYFMPALMSIILIASTAVKLRRTRKGGWLWDRFKLRMPIFGSLCQNIALARFARTMGTLLRGGVPILGSCVIGGKSSGNIVIESAAARISEYIEAGGTFTDGVRLNHIFPPLMEAMIGTGEQSGCIPEMLDCLAAHFDQEVEGALGSLTSMIEPLLIMFLGIVLGSVVVAMFLPIFNISQIVQF